MFFGAFSLYKQNMKKSCGSATCDNDVKGRLDKGIGHFYGPLKSEKDTLLGFISEMPGNI